MKMIKLLLPLALLFTASTIQAAHHESGDFDAAWAAADKKRAEAAALDYEWINTGKLLKKAKEANAKGKTEKAMKLVAKALEQANDAIAQAERESSQWQARVPK